ncbi:unnamed protein product [Protopolystoma xenopodis]|uniref:Uncharacterized protein n=1 Tax=Protopolystoma xenopodis TaxID=117903 RepID=A0A3S5CIQ2_9PLAT|nr:unnamed protein product [Protopolystoma xenopodis]
MALQTCSDRQQLSMFYKCRNKSLLALQLSAGLVISISAGFGSDLGETRSRRLRGFGKALMGTAYCFGHLRKVAYFWL